MATYDLDRARLDALLDRHVSRETENAIFNILKDAGFLPRGHHTIGVETETIGGSYAVPGGDKLFLDLGASGVMNVTTQGGVVIAAGDGANTIRDLGPGGDTLIGGAGAEMLQVTHGANLLEAGGGLNTLAGGSGHDTLIGGGASLLEAGAGGSTLIGGLYPDPHSFGDHGPGDNDKGGRKGSGEHGHHGGHHKDQTVPSDTLMGGSGDDLLRVWHGDNLIYAGTGKDTIYAGDGHDTIIGSTAPTATGAMDTIYLGTGDTSVQGGAAGAETIYAGMHGNDTIFGSASGADMTVYSQQSSHAIKSESVKGGVTTITFHNHQTLILQGVTINFSDGGSQKV